MISDQRSKPIQVLVARPRYGGLFELDAGEPSPYVLPGEAVELPRAGSYGEPRGPVCILKPASIRVAPGCVHFGQCGGCHYQHASYPAQVAIKREILASLLAQAGLGELPEIGVHSAEPWAYRNRVRLRLDSGGAPAWRWPAIRLQPAGVERLPAYPDVSDHRSAAAAGG